MEEEKDRPIIEETEQELYARKAPAPEEFHELKKTESIATRDAWDTPRPIIRHSFIARSSHAAGNFAKTFFKISIGILVVAGLIATYMFYGGSRSFSNERVGVRILGSGFSDGGAPLSVSIEITNTNKTALTNAQVTVAYEKDSGSTIGDPYTYLPKVTIGTIDAGATKSVEQTVVLYGEQNATKNIKATLEYRMQGSNALLSKVATLPVVISRAPVTLSFDGPLTTTPNQPMSFTLKATSNSDVPIQHLLLSVEYPAGFVFSSATPTPSYGNNVWALGDLAQGAEQIITFTGALKGFEGEDRIFRVSSGVESGTDKTRIGLVYNALTHTVALSKSFLGVTASINGSPLDEVPLPTNTESNVTINYTNTLDTRVSDAQITVVLGGNSFDQNSVSTQDGFFNSTTSTITFDKSTIGALAMLEPGQSGELEFSVTPRDAWSGTSLIQNPVISFSVNVSGKQSGFGGVTEVTNVLHKSVKFGTLFQLATETLYSAGPFQNTGGIPPHVGVETTYTIVWNIKNTANIASGVEVHATLPSYVTFKNRIYPATAGLTYDPTSRTLSWKVGKVNAGAGFISPDTSVAFQIGFIPSISQINMTPNLIVGTEANGIDTFTNKPLHVTKGNSTTTPTDGSGGGQVQ